MDHHSSVAAYQDYQKRIGMAPFPAAEIKSMYEINPDGSVGRTRTPSYVQRAVDDGSIAKDYRGIGVPVLALFAVERPFAERSSVNASKNEEERRDCERAHEILTEFVRRWQRNLKSADPKAEIVGLPTAHHYIFLSEQQEVLERMQAFLSKLRD